MKWKLVPEFPRKPKPATVGMRLGRMITWAKVLRRRSHWAVIAADRARRLHPAAATAEHLAGTMDWLCAAHDATGATGVAMAYDMVQGWLPSYPETTGYIIPTFLDYGRRTGRQEYARRAVAMGEWLSRTQLPNGAIRGSVAARQDPMVFDTGQVIVGWMALHGQTQRQEFLDAAVRGARWLVAIQDGDGKWVKHSFNAVPHAYYTRVAWTMFQVAAATGEAEIHQAALRNVEWVMNGAHPNGWFEHMGFQPDKMPLTHTIAYTLDGLQECLPYLPAELSGRVRAAVEKAAAALLRTYEARQTRTDPVQRFLPGQLNPDWSPAADYSCLTGNAQIAIIWMRLVLAGAGQGYLNAAGRLLNDVKATQNPRSSNPGVRWGVAGSYPIWGEYARFLYPNWGAKFLADALMLWDSIAGAGAPPAVGQTSEPARPQWSGPPVVEGGLKAAQPGAKS